MYVLRGRRESLAADLAATDDLVERTRDTGEPGVRVWRPPKNVAFGRRDGNRDGYERAREAATAHGYPIAERSVGGHAVAFTGSTVAFAVAEPVEDSRTGITDRYDRVTGRVNAALEELGVDAHEGEPEGAFCPGTHSLSGTGKIAGLAQRVHSDVAVTSGILLVEDHEAVADVLAPIYDALAVDFEREAVGSIARAGGDTDRVVESLIDRLTAGSVTVDSV
ncbi:Lipoate-protein ligase A [Halovenus aranensis]|jgi:lipoate-protein ligase A|uniref:Lipoate-protein ligase A n=1 Tax=Halovenus aranensis TaxID=890420 RepID=A0A1G8YJT3_9EURY|nr:lipoate--protein ligase family protein [Halovenus aranensis]SDK03068.1 Lipoate-protein ligase A [Halovenus aranensis]